MQAYIDICIDNRSPEPFGLLPRITVEKHQFAGGETHMTIPNLPQLKGMEHVCVVSTGQGNHNVMEFLQVVNILRNNGIDKVSLYMPYFYYSRQDRATTPESSFALRIFCDILKLCNFEDIYTHDLHSPVAHKYLNNISNIHPVNFLKTVWKTFPYDYIIAPDKGACDKIEHLCIISKIPVSQIICATKQRDPATGRLSEPHMDEDYLSKIKGKRLLVFDDICDGGYTFIQLAEYLKRYADFKIDLAVTHGIFSKGLDVLKKHYGNVFTTDSMKFTHKAITIKDRIL